MQMQKDISCSDLAQERNAPLVGTATHGDLWFLVEYSGRWEAKAFQQSSLPLVVKEHLLDAAAAAKNGRILLIRQTDSHRRPGLRFFIAQVDPQTPHLYEYQLEDPLDLLDLDLLAFAAGQPGPSEHLSQEPLYLVCTNGLRDACCARLGPQVYQVLTEQAGEAVWQSSHIGGHNKAPVLLFFPHGLNYGRVTPQEANQVCLAYQRGEISLAHYRGRVCYPPPVQAAEYFWRVRNADTRLPGPQFGPEISTDAQTWQVPVQDATGQSVEVIQIESWLSTEQIAITCTGSKLAPIETFTEFIP